MCAINRNTRDIRIFSKIQISFAGNRAKASLYNAYTGIVRWLTSGIIQYVSPAFKPHTNFIYYF